MSGFAPLLEVLMWLVLAGLLVWLIVTLIRALQNQELAAAERVDEDDGRSHIERVEALPVAVERRVTDLLAEARRLHQSGDPTLAVVYLFSHELVLLDRHGLVRLVKGKTNRQYLREVRRNAAPHPATQAIADILEQVMLLFERAFFGAHPPGAAQLQACFDAVTRLEILAAQATEAV